MNPELAKYGNMPMSSASLALDFPEIKKSGQKLAQLERKGDLIRLRRGLYVCPEKISGMSISLELLANHLLSPSYITMLSALRYYSLIPEAVHLVQSATTKESRHYDTPFGRFSYTQVAREEFNIGIRNIEENGYSFLIATPEKALCDLIANTPRLSLRYRKEALEYLEADLRFDMDSFYNLNPEIFRLYISKNGKKSRSISSILTILTENAQRDI